MRYIVIFIFLILALPTWGKESESFEVLQKLVTNFSDGKISEAELLIDQSMIGRQEIIEAMNESIFKQKQIRISFHDKSTHKVGNEVVVVKTGWEKKYLVVPAMTAETQKGQTLFFIQRMKQKWKLVGQSGDNLFAPSK